MRAGWPTVIFRPVPRALFVGAVLAYVVLRIYLATLPGYVVDVTQYKEWAFWTARNGLSTAYDSASVDYPPLFLYPMHAVGTIYLAVTSQPVPGKVIDSTLFTFLVKSPHIVFDLALGALLYWAVSRGRTWGSELGGAGWGRLAALLYWWNPAVLWGSGYWGQPDGAHSALLMAALLALAADRTARSGALLSAAGLMKPLAAPLVPVLAWTAALRKGIRGLALMAGGGILAAAVVFAPFIVTGRLLEVLRRVFVDVEAMAFTSVNAHNLWWILGPWRDADAAVVGPVTPKGIGLVLFGTAYAVLLWRTRGRLRAAPGGSPVLRAELLVIAAAVTSSFFLLSTHMHENHLFMTVPLLLAVAGRSPRLAWLALGCSAAVFFNQVLHDVDLPYRMPSFLGALSPVIDRHLDRPYTWLQFVGSFFNTLLVAWVAAGTWWVAWRGRS